MLPYRCCYQEQILDEVTDLALAQCHDRDFDRPAALGCEQMVPRCDKYSNDLMQHPWMAQYLPRPPVALRSVGYHMCFRRAPRVACQTEHHHSAPLYASHRRVFPDASNGLYILILDPRYIPH